MIRNLVWSRPSSEQEPKFVHKCGDYNYNSKYEGATSELHFSEDCLESLKKDGYAINHAKVKLGHGSDTYEKAKMLITNWRHFDVGWAFVAPRDTPIKQGKRFCVCSQEMFAWILNPLQIVYVQKDQTSKNKCIYSFGSGTLRGHLLAGEERFTIEWNKEDNSIWYEIFSFSKADHFISAATYPYVRFKQMLFAKHSTQTMLKQMNS